MQLVALVSGVVLGGVAMVVGSSLGRGEIFTASIGSVESLYPSVYIYLLIYSNKNCFLTKCCVGGGSIQKCVLTIQIESSIYEAYISWYDTIRYVLY